MRIKSFTLSHTRSVLTLQQLRQSWALTGAQLAGEFCSADKVLLGAPTTTVIHHTPFETHSSL